MFPARLPARLPACLHPCRRRLWRPPASSHPNSCRLLVPASYRPANAGWGHARRHSPAALQVVLELADNRQACLCTLTHPSAARPATVMPGCLGAWLLRAPCLGASLTMPWPPDLPMGRSALCHAVPGVVACCAAAVTLAPTQLDALDCISLDYQVGWPLNAVLTEVGGWSMHCSTGAPVEAFSTAPWIQRSHNCMVWVLLPLGPCVLPLVQDTVQGCATVTVPLPERSRVSLLWCCAVAGHTAGLCRRVEHDGPPAALRAAAARAARPAGIPAQVQLRPAAQVGRVAGVAVSGTSARCRWGMRDKGWPCVQSACMETPRLRPLRMN